MFEVSLRDIEQIAKDFGIFSKIASCVELQRYHYERGNPESKEVRLIDKVTLADNASVVIRFKNEEDVSLELIEKQSRFAELLRQNGIPCPMQYKASGSFAKWYTISGYDVIVTVEEFVDGELSCVDKEMAEKTGKLLARMHNIAEKQEFHVENAVLFDPFEKNDLFSFADFKSIGEKVTGEDQVLFQKIVDKYEEYMELLSPLRLEPRFAVQGDISDCNLYQSKDGTLGIFDFNRCGDNNLYCDAVMQAVFEARLMEYPESYAGKNESIILPAFFEGYQSERPFNDTQRKLFSYLYAVIDAFWSQDIVWSGDSLKKAWERKDFAAMHDWLEVIWKRISA